VTWLILQQRTEECWELPDEVKDLEAANAQLRLQVEHYENAYDAVRSLFEGRQCLTSEILGGPACWVEAR
jgi:hypothetical protein